MSNVEKEMKYTFIHDGDFDETGVIKIAHPESCSIKFESDESQRKVKLIRVLLEGENPEPQKQYRYEKVTSVFQIAKDEMDAGFYCQLFSGDYYTKQNERDVVSALINDELYRKVEVDPVEGLAKEFHAIDALHEITSEEFDDINQDAINAYMEMAKHAIEKLGSN
ncbi:hypothetical protein NVP1189B_64 [Vibrio phage 1.189.B._10N.286.51.B5]|nr:hypothetical protein NVP1189B_64 [Vibrio phage 1.189.B._10N.286.51.B5]AUR93956.1 hypothetical protein NVP1189C_64 [Vibrio phage 1.189.C._10N.286.51.B5]AUR94022.1 hypothetical protein NVP1189O_64 [Vibrio phage 1.189.O._10N.286.51.B5]